MFDIRSHYDRLLAEDATLTPPIAAIESLIALLFSSSLQTVSETLSLLSSASNVLLASQRNPLPISAGTDLFQRYLITSFNQSPLSSQSGSDFTALRNQLITNSKLFVQRAKTAKSKIASHALPLLFGPVDDSGFQTTVITFGVSRVVSAILRLAAEKNRWFNVIHITSHDKPRRRNDMLDTLRSANIPVAQIPLSSLSLAIATLPSNTYTKTSSSTIVLLGTSVVLENGAVVAESGCSLVASTARSHGLPVYITAESFKFVRQFPIGCGEMELKRMGVKQESIHFETGKQGTTVTTTAKTIGDKSMVSSSSPSSQQANQPIKDPKQITDDELLDITAPEYITGIVTETGMMTPSAVAEELIKLWF